MSPATISVVIPAHNAAHTLAACVASVRAQTRPADQLLVVDDGSTDATAGVASGLGPGVTFVPQPHRGPGAARNAGLARATGDWLAFLDADDLWQPEFLRRTADFLAREPQAVAVSTGGEVRLANGAVRPVPAPHPALPAGPALLDDFFACWAAHDHVRTGTVLMRTDVARRVGGQREDLWISQDLEFWAMLATAGAWGFLPDRLWLGNSRVAARVRGLRQKYAERRRRCPTVAAWEARVRPRLTSAQQAAFQAVRGWVAAGFLHAQLAGGDWRAARELYEQYGAALPRNRVTQLVAALGALGGPGWRLAGALLRLREGLKA